MRAEELRIGDWVKIDLVDCPSPVQIGGIIPKHGTLFAYIDEFPLLVPFEKLQAIPLTADLLGKNGFHPTWVDEQTWEDERIYEYCYNGYKVHVQKDGEFINLLRAYPLANDDDEWDLVGWISVTGGDRLAVHNLQHFLTENYISIKIEV